MSHCASTFSARIKNARTGANALGRALGLLALMTLLGATAQAQVSVTASAGTTGPTAYTTLTGAFDAINAGTHMGDVTIDIAATTAEGATPAVLNSSGAGAASYTSVLIRPTADGVAIVGTSAAGRGIIELNGADNVTIDGDNPGTAGINRNLTVQNTAVSTTGYTSVVRIALSTLVTSANADTVKNCIITGSAAGRNIAAATSTTGSEHTTYGILVGGGASTVAATTAPSAITSVSTLIGSGITVTGFTADNNQIDACARGIAVQGSAITVAAGLTVTNNVIGSASAGNTTTVYSRGMTLQGFDTTTISGNTIRNIESFIGTGTMGLSLGDVTGIGTNAIIEKNVVTNVFNQSTGTYGAYGINVAAGPANTVRNNFVSNINHVMTGGGAFSTTYGVFGIRLASGSSHSVYHNSVNLYGAFPGTAATSLLSAAFAIVATAQTGLDVRNNVFSNTLTGGTTSVAHVSIYLPSAGTSAMNLTLNNNGYYAGVDTARQGLAQAGTTAGTGFYLTSNFDATVTTPATNFRSYSSTLSAAGTNDAASFASTSAAPFTTATDLHIPAGTVTLLESGGVGTAVTGVLTDIDGDARPNGAAPDIGADEFVGVMPPANDIAATAIVVPATGSVVGNGISVTPQASFKNVGIAAQTSVSVQFTMTGPGGYSYTDPQTIATINPGQTVTVTFSAAPAFSTIGIYSTAATVLTADADATNNQVTGSLEVRNSLAGGAYNVPGDFSSLTNPGGIFSELDTVGATGNVVINIAGDLTGETGAFALNELAGGYTVTIAPTGAPRTITGTSAASTALIKLNGADGVTIDGSLSGGTDRSLTITNGSATSAVIWIASASASNGASNDTVKNCNISGTTGVIAISGVLAGGAAFGVAADAPNSNNTIQNNLIFGGQNALFVSGNVASLDQNWLITGNTFGSAVVGEKLSFRGMLIQNAQNFTISDNTILGVVSTVTSTSTMTGIQVSSAVNGGSIVRNRISDIKQRNPGGYGCNGIYLAASTTASNLVVANNFIWDVAAYGWTSATAVDNGYGIMVNSGGGYSIAYNTVHMGTDQTLAGSITAAINVAAAVTTAGSIDLRDNVFSNAQTVGNRYAIYDSSTAAIFSTINYNDYFAPNVGFLAGAQATLAAWQGATGQDAASVSVDPLFRSATDLHLLGTSSLLGAGTPVAGITSDFDNDPRPAAAPDMGADEVVQAVAGSIPAGTYYNALGANGDVLGGGVTVTNELTLTGIVSTGANTLSLGCTATVTGAGATNYVVGNLKKTFCGAGAKSFEVGTANGYSPVDANTTAGTFPADLTVTGVQGPQPFAFPSTLALQRYWTLTGSGITTDLTFHYLALDVPGTANEANFVIYKFNGAAYTKPGGSVTPATHQAFIAGVTSFSDWTVAEPATTPVELMNFEIE